MRRPHAPRVRRPRRRAVSDEKEHVCRLGAGDPKRIVGLREHGQRLVEERRRSVRRELSARHERQDELDAGAELDRSVTRVAGTARRGFEELDRLIEPPDALQRRTQTALDLHPIQRLLVEERRRALQEVRGRRVVERQERTLAGGSPRRADASCASAVRPARSLASCAARSRCVPTSSSPSPRPSSQRANVSCIAGPLRAADRVVGGAADERMDELVLVAARADEPAPLERREPAPELPGLGVGRQRAERLPRERAPDDRRPREDGALAGLERVDPAREQRVEARRDPLVREVGLRCVRGELLEEERHALGRLEDRRRERLVERVALREAHRRGRRASSPPSGSSTVAPLAPGGSPLEKLRPRHGDHEQGAVDGADDVLDEVEERRDRPVEVVEHDDDRAAER